jgi:threonine/homoserine/homoserine lactone efflux protein
VVGRPEANRARAVRYAGPVTTSLLAFAVFAAILTVTPGLDTLLVLRASAVGGPAAGIATALGIGSGLLIWATASAVGVTAVLAASQLAFNVLRIAGAVYLVWLGAKALWSLRRRATAAAPSSASVLAEPGEPGDRWTWWRALRTGLTTNLLNPKVGVFYLSVLPQFLPDGVHPLVGSLALALIHNLESLLWLSLLAVLVTRARGWFSRPTVRRRFEQVTGVVLVALGLRLALDGTR